MSYQPIHGVITPIVTPFADTGEIHPSAIKPLADYLIGHGIKGIFPIGTTGEGVLLTTEERKTIAEATIKAVDGRVPVIIHTGAITTQHTLDLTQHAQSAGADAVAIVAPYYFQHTPQALETHYRTVIEANPDMPIYLYNFPAVTGNTLSRELVIKLAKHYDNVVGLKDSSGDLQTLFATNNLKKGHFNTAIGPDELILAGLSMGLDASVSGHANVIPEIVVSLYNATKAGNLEEAQSIQRLLIRVNNVLNSGGWLPLVKGVMQHRGLPVGGVRRPLLSADDEAIRACIGQLTALRVSLESA